MNDEVERACEAIEYAAPAATGLEWTPGEQEKWERKAEARRRWLRTPAGRLWAWWDRVKWRHLSRLVEPVLQRIAGYFDWYLET